MEPMSTVAFPVFCLAAVIASDTATKHPRDWFQIFLKILFICFLLGKKRKRFHQHCLKTALAETFGERRKNCSLNAFVEAHSFLEEL
jgi:hypothetical protein